MNWSCHFRVTSMNSRSRRIARLLPEIFSTFYIGSHFFVTSTIQKFLTILLSIPIQSIATNGPSLVHKVRFVASTLLDAVRKVETAPASAARAHAYLCWPRFFIMPSHYLTNISGDFLSILSEIERNYL